MPRTAPWKMKPPSNINFSDACKQTAVHILPKLIHAENLIASVAHGPNLKPMQSAAPRKNCGVVGRAAVPKQSHHERTNSFVNCVSDGSTQPACSKLQITRALDSKCIPLGQTLHEDVTDRVPLSDSAPPTERLVRGQ